MSNATSDDFVYFAPKCLVLLSHYPFFSAQGIILKELFFTIQSGTSPIPFERYVAHILDDIPLPPRGITRIQWDSWTNQNQVVLERPAPHKLPLLNLSVEPLLRIISISNLLVLWATLLQEGRVILCCSSNNISLLTPIAEVLLGLLFPLEWQGLYVPILPSNMKDVLDAPVPYLLGVGSLPRDIDQPAGSIIYDVDTDVLHLGWKENGEEQEALPAFPEAPIMRLKTELEELGDPLYLPPPLQTEKGCITVGDKSRNLENASRQAYAQMTRLSGGPSARSYILSQSCKVSKSGWTRPLQADDYQLTHKYRPQDTTRTVRRCKLETQQEESTSAKENTTTVMNSFHRRGRRMQAHADKFMAVVAGSSYATNSSYASRAHLDDILGQQDEIANNLFDIDMEQNNQIRNAFLTCLTTLFGTYKKFTQQDTNQINIAAFVESMRLSQRYKDYVKAVVGSQMFEEFLNKGEDDLWRKIFDDRIASIKERQDKVKMADEAKKWQIKSCLIPAAPSSIGIQQGRLFHGDKRFPSKLDPQECVTSSNMSAFRAFLNGAMFGTCCALRCFDLSEQYVPSKKRSYDDGEEVQV